VRAGWRQRATPRLTSRVTVDRATAVVIVSCLAAVAWGPAALSAQPATACDAVAQLVAAVPSLVPTGRDSLVHDERFGRTVPGCLLRFAGRVSAFPNRTEPSGLLRDGLAARGWQEDLRYAADGPDGTSFALRHDSTLCLISASWDGGDDSDPTYTPSDRYELAIGCAEGEPEMPRDGH
jgi:hypothetical protein